MQKHDTLLIACGSLESRRHLRSVLKTQFNLLEATNTRQMLLLLEQNLDCIAAVVLDISNWDVIDQSIGMDPEAVALLKQCPVIVVGDKEFYQDLTHYFRYGAADVIPLNYDPYAMIHRIETITQLSIHKRNLEETVAAQEESLRHFSDNMVDALSSIIEYRNMESGLHTLRIRNFTRMLLEEVKNHCPEYGLTDRLLPIISSASALHDVGKIGIPDAILTKPGKLTPEEWEIMKSHSLLGSKMLNNLSSTVDQEYLRYAYNICLYHHERWDGRGYPEGLKGDDIPICAQVVGLADCYDALTSDRVYKAAYPHAKAANMILGGECGAFSPKLLECFKKVAQPFAELAQAYADGRNPEEALADLSLPKPSSPEQNISLLEKTQAKYYAIIHYLNAFLMEIQLDTGVFQVIYNPYPELANLSGAHSLAELTDIVAQQVVIPEEKERIYAVIRREIPQFIRDDLRRKSYYFHHRPYADEPSGTFELTLVRIGGADLGSSLSIICRKLEHQQSLSPKDDRLMHMATECTYICYNDSGFTLVRPGRETRSLGGYTPEEVMERFGGRLLDMAFPEERAAIREEFNRQLREGSMVRTSYRFLCKDGSIGWVVNKSQLIVAADGQEYLRTFLFDITDLKQENETLRSTLDRDRAILSQTENVLFQLDVPSSTIEFSQTWETVFGYKASRAQFSRQMSGETHVHPDDIPLLLDRLQLLAHKSEAEMVEIRIANAQGRYLWCRVRGAAGRDETGKLIQVSGMIMNIQSDKQRNQALEDKANRDSLTHLLNKNAGKEKVEYYIAHSPNAKGAMLVLDLDNFKEVNDRYGHLFGDALLTHVAQILKNLFHTEDIIARIGGDEFMVFIPGVSDQHLIASQCRRLKDMLLDIFQRDTIDLNLGCSIGIAITPDHGSTYVELFARADIALYQAKADGKNDFCFYSQGSAMGYVPNSHFSTSIDSELSSGVTYQVFRTLNQTKDFPAAVNQTLAMLGRKHHVSRVYIFENSEDGAYCSNTFEWCGDGISPEMENLQNLSYDADIPDYQDNLGAEGVFYCHDIQELDDSSRKILEVQGIRSMLHCAIGQDGEFKGYVGFDQCDRNRMWTKEEIQSLSECSEILSAFLLRYREHEKLRRQSQLLRDQNLSWSYTVDPEGYELRQADESIRRIRPELTLGGPCYRELMDRTGPCQGCPLEGLSQEDHVWSILEDPQGHGKILMEAEAVQWQGRPACRVTCRQLPKRQK